MRHEILFWVSVVVAILSLLGTAYATFHTTDPIERAAGNESYWTRRTWQFLGLGLLSAGIACVIPYLHI